MSDQRTVYSLKDPITLGSRQIVEFSFRPAKAKDMRDLGDGNDIDRTLKLAARLAGELDVVIDEMSIRDMQEVSKIVAVFLGHGPTTGSEP